MFASDPPTVRNASYVSDNRGDNLFRVGPADFLQANKAPTVTLVFTRKSFNPNGICPGAVGSPLMVGSKSADEARGIASITPLSHIMT